MFDGISVIFFWSDTTTSGMTEALYQRSRIKLQFVESKWFVVIFIFENQHEKSNKKHVSLLEILGWWERSIVRNI